MKTFCQHPSAVCASDIFRVNIVGILCNKFYGCQCHETTKYVTCRFQSILRFSVDVVDKTGYKSKMMY